MSDDQEETPEQPSGEGPEVDTSEGSAAPQGAPVPASDNAAPTAPDPQDTPYVGSTSPQLQAPSVQDLNNEHAARQQDFASGHISPETMSSLFHKKDTLGKIGTIFGLLLSGAGSGLAHQPDALMEMMNKEIERDLERQKATNANAQNWYRLNQQHELQNIQIPQMQAATALAKAQATKVPFENQQAAALALEHARKADVERAKIKAVGGVDTSASDAAQKVFIDTMASNASHNDMLSATGQDLQNKVDKIPPGATKAQAQTTLDTQVKPAITAKIIDNNKKAAGKAALISAAAAAEGKKNAPQGQGQAPGGLRAVNVDKLKQMQLQGQHNVSIGMAPNENGGISDQEAERATAESGEAQGIMDSMVAYNHAFDRLDRSFLAGKLTPELVAAQEANLLPILAKSTAGRYVTAEAEKQGSGVLPSYKDFGDSRSEKHLNTMNTLSSQLKQLPTINKYPQLMNPVPYVKVQSPKGAIKWRPRSEAQSWVKKGGKIVE